MDDESIILNLSRWNCDAENGSNQWMVDSWIRWRGKCSDWLYHRWVTESVFIKWCPLVPV